MHSIEAEGLAVAFAAAAPVLRDVAFCLGAGWHGLVGANGAGKTTLLRVLAGELRPEAGTVRVRPKEARIVLCTQEVTDLPEDVVRFAEDHATDSAELRSRLALDAEELAPSRWATLSSGERKRWQIAAALAAEPDVLLLDEPTNHLDRRARGLLVSTLRRFRGIGVLVSHDRALLDELPNDVLRIQEGSVARYSGGYTEAAAAWQTERRAAEEEHHAARARVRAMASRLADARREHARAVRGRSTGARMKDRYDSDARGGLAKGKAALAEARAGRAVGVVRSALERAERDVPQLTRDPTVGSSVFAAYARATRTVLFHLDADVTATAGGAVILEGVRLTIGREDRVRIAGENGAGKTTLLRALLGTWPAGASDERLLYLPQELPPARVVADMASLRALDSAALGRVLSIFGALGSDPARLLGRGSAPTRDASLSPGEARKLALALGLGRHVWALVLDEPTNHLDLPTLERLERAFVDYPGALVVVTHDDRFAAATTDRTVLLANGMLSR